MPSKKKSRPSFKVPEDLESAPQAGWVYRSEPAAEAEPAPVREPEDREPERRQAPWEESDTWEHDSGKTSSSDEEESSSDDILDLTAKTFSSGVETIGNALRLGAAILTAPIRMGLWIIGFRSRD